MWDFEEKKQKKKVSYEVKSIAKCLIAFIVALIILTNMTGCSADTSYAEETSTEQKEVIRYESLFYNNTGNNYLTFDADSFDISPNKVKLWGYNTDGTWSSYYETSSVMTVKINDSYIQTTGSTIIFKDTRLEMYEIPEIMETTTVVSNDKEITVDKKNADTYFSLKYWFGDFSESEYGQHGAKTVLIQSQDGYNIGLFVGDDVTWEVAGELPKTTKITIDGKLLYLHRCNFSIIDNSLLE